MRRKKSYSYQGKTKESNHVDILLDANSNYAYWCEWFLTTLHKALIEAIESIEHVVDKAKFWDKHRESTINDRQTKVLNMILDRGVNHPQSGLTTKKYMKIAGTTSATASRDIKGLLELGCIEQVEGTGGRSVMYLVLA